LINLHLSPPANKGTAATCHTEKKTKRETALADKVRRAEAIPNDSNKDVVFLYYVFLVQSVDQYL
jgi:hypothetical protein